MKGGLHTTQARPSRPAIGLWVPTAAVHIAFLAIGAGLCVLLLEPPFWLSFGLLLAVAGTFFPGIVHRAWVLLVLCLSQFWREPSVTDSAFYLLIAGAHLLHMLGSLAAHMPWHGRIQQGAFVQPLKRFVMVQAVVQPIAVGALTVLGSGRGTVPGLSIAAAAILGIIALVLGRGLMRARAD